MMMIQHQNLIKMVFSGLVLFVTLCCCNTNANLDTTAKFDVVRLLTTKNIDCAGVVVDSETIITTKFCLRGDIIGIEQAPDVEVLGYTFQSNSELVLLLVDRFSNEQPTVQLSTTPTNNEELVDVFGYNCEHHTIFYSGFWQPLKPPVASDTDTTCQSSGNGIFNSNNESNNELIGIVVDQDHVEDLTLVKQLLSNKRLMVDN